MTTIKLKRGNDSNLSSLVLQAGEPAFSLDTGKLYIGDGTNNIIINPDVINSQTSSKLQNARTISIAGDATGSTSFDGSANASITVSLSNSGVTSGTYTKLTVDSKGRVISGSQLSASDIPSLTLAKITDVGTSASKNVGNSVGNIPIINSNGKLDESIIPSIAISDTFIVASQSAMLALTAEVGDIAIRTDLSKTFILRTSSASVIGNWQELITPTSPVQSVSGKTGTVVLSSADVGLGNVTNESKTTMFSNPTFTGIPVAPTAALSANNTQVATTAFVKSQGYLTSSSDIDGGTF